MKQRSKINWADPPKPVVFSEVTFSKGSARAPGVVGEHGFAMLATPNASKGACLWLPSLIYYVREACLMFPAFRAELEEMLSLIPAAAPASEAPEPVADPRVEP